MIIAPLVNAKVAIDNSTRASTAKESCSKLTVEDMEPYVAGISILFFLIVLYICYPLLKSKGTTLRESMPSIEEWKEKERRKRSGK